MKRLLLALGIVAWALPAQAQNAITQEGSVIQNSPVMFRGNNRARQGAGVGGAANGQIVTTGDAVVGGRCDYSAPTDAAGGYYRLCLDAATGKITLDGTKSPPIDLSVSINGAVYGFPGQGNGNVVGPSPTIMNEITSWNSATGTALRQGRATMTDNKTAAQTVDSGTLSAFTQPGITAMSIANAVCGGTAGCGYMNNDALRGVAVADAGSSVVNTTAVAGYLRNKNVSGTPPSFGQNAVLLFGSGTCEVDGCKSWGVNTVLVDSAGKGLLSGPNRALIGAEYDFIASNTATAVIGVMVTGDALVQPTLANAYAVLPLGQGGGATPIRWINGFITASGAAAFSLVSGASQVSGNDVESQKIIFSYYDNVGAPGSVGLGVGTNAAFAGNTPQLTFTSTAPWVDVVLPGKLKLKSFPPGAIEINGHNVLQAGFDAAGNDIFIANAATIANVAVGGINAVLTLAGTAVDIDPRGGPLSLQTLPAVAAGTGKRFLCIDTLTKRVYEGSGVSCN